MPHLTRDPIVWQ